MNNKSNEFLTCFNWINTGQLMKNNNLNKGQLIVFTLILAMFEYNDILSIYDVKKANRTNEFTTMNNIASLRKKGLIKTQRSNQYFSRAYLSLTDKGLLLKSQLKKILSTTLGIDPPTK